MPKKNIGKILATGSAKQRALLLAEAIAKGKFSEGNILSDQEFNQLNDSFQKPNEIKIYNEFKRADETVSNALINLQGLLFEVKMNYSNLRGYILTWNAIENAELLVNSVLHETKDVKERKRIAEEGAKGINLLFSKTETDQEGYIDIKIDFEKDSYHDENGNYIGRKARPKKTKEFSLWYVMNNVKKETETAVVKYLSWEKAILDYMDEKGFRVKTYKEKIKEMTDQVYSPIIGWEKYSGKLKSGLPHPLLEPLMSKYAICPNMEELKTDRAQYNWFKNHILGSE